MIISPLPKTAKDIFREIIGLKDDEICNLNINYKDLISEKNLLKINSIDWYCFILFTKIEYNLLVYNDIEKVPKELFEQLYHIYDIIQNNNNKTYKNLDSFIKTKILVVIQFYAEIINSFYPEKIECLNGFKIINDLNQFITGASSIKKDLTNICFLMMKILFELDNLKLIKNKEKESVYDKFYNLFLTLKNIFIKQNIDNPEQKKEKEELKKKFKESFINYEENKELLNSILDSEKNGETIDFITKEEKVLNNFIEYERCYRHVMKEQFIFNHFWSNKKLFFDEKIKKNELKYKSINYYTENYQKPIIYPILDYKNQYPSFTFFNIDDNFYMKEESKDNYIFNIESQELDELIDQYTQNNLELIEEKYKNSILIYDACLVKRTHHVKGKIFLIKKNEKVKKLYFLSYNKKSVDSIPSCNELEKNTQQEVLRKTVKSIHSCYGSFFTCPNKDCNILIKINIEDIRMILRRIYYYRKSGFEIFTSNKSYYFNLYENSALDNYKEKMGESNCIKIITLLFNSLNDEYIPIDIKDQAIGYSKAINYDNKDIVQNINQKNIINIPNTNNKNKNKNIDKDKANNKDGLPKEDSNFIDDLLKRWMNADNNNSYINNNISTFDLIIILNLLSNRSYNDLYQYPVFPVLFFYDKKDDDSEDYTLVPRSLNNHLGFQTDTKLGEKRKTAFINSYEITKEEINDGISYIKEAYYFNTNYSNSIYTCNFLLRIFPFSFIAIEMQGDGFDDPNRLFYSIEKTFNMISSNNADLREMTPEFFYLPEIFMNINRINFKKKKTDLYVDNVEIPKDIKVKENSNNNINDDNICNRTYFKFIEYMKNYLENKNLEIYNWLNLIFGFKQRYHNLFQKDQYFRTETYISFNKADTERLNEYLKNDVIMTSVEFGLVPIQILFSDKEIKEIKGKALNSNYSTVNKNNIISQLNNKVYNDKKFIINVKNDESEINDININFLFKKRNNNIKFICNNLGKINLFINDKLISEFYDHKDIIKYIDYNKRLNMFITTSIDGYSCIYSFPNKLVSVIKHPDKRYFDYTILGSNPFPFIIAFDKKSKDFYSYSLNGFLIHKENLSKFIGDDLNNVINIYPIFDTDGGTNKDVLVIQDEKGNNFIINLPFFEKID